MSKLDLIEWNSEMLQCAFADWKDDYEFDLVVDLSILIGMGIASLEIDFLRGLFKVLFSVF